MQRPSIRPVSIALMGTSAVGGGTLVAVGDDMELAQPSTLLPFACIVVIAATVVRHLLAESHRRIHAALEQADRDLAAERSKRARLEGEYKALTEDYNELAREQALEQTEQSGARFPRPDIAVVHGPEADHGPLCQCRRRGPRPFLVLVDQRRQESG